MIATVVLVLRLALAIALYVFLGWSLLILWRELSLQGKTISNQKKRGSRSRKSQNKAGNASFIFTRPRY